MKNSPETLEIEMSKLAVRWKWVSIGDIDVYVLLNAPIEVLGPASRTFAFGEVESQVEAFAPNVEDERAGNGDGDRDGDVGGMDGTTSSGGIHSK